MHTSQALNLARDSMTSPSVKAVGAESLRLQHIWKRFPGVTALRDVSFTAVAGEVHALLGENGAGKSTLMAIASGDQHPDSGTIEINGKSIDRLGVAKAQRLGLAIVHQHPAILPDLTVAENMLLAVPRRLRGGDARDMDWVAEQLKQVGSTVHPKERMTQIDIAQRHLIELAKALSIDPKVLILDEPSAPLTPDLVDLMFERVRAAADRGAAIVYISHRLQEIRRIADRVTIMRDGAVQRTAPTHEMSDDEMLRLIVGRAVTNTFPPKALSRDTTGRHLVVKRLSGRNFYDVDLETHPGEIVGIAGITGNGQSEFLRALGGLVDAAGTVALGGKALKTGSPEAAYEAGIAFLSSDRQKEGLFMSLSVRENAAVAALPLFARLGIVRRHVEHLRVNEQRQELAIRTPTIDTAITSLSGGNQQKVVIARALLFKASLILAEEPTAGVDVGARAEIYRILRDAAHRGTSIVIVSSDLMELEGLCDRVIVFSRGHVVGELSGPDVTEEKIGRTMITATSQRRTVASGVGSGFAKGSVVRRFIGGDYAPSLVLAVMILALVAYTASQNLRFISPFNVEKMLLLTSALAFIAIGQMCAVFTSGIDLSVGPLVGLSVVIGSFFFLEGYPLSLLALGLICILAVAAVTGSINGSLVRFGNYTAVAATLGVYIILQGISVLLRPFPDGNIGSDVISWIQTSIGSVPVAFIVVLALAIALEIALRYARWGLSLRAVGSNLESAARIGVAVNRTIVGAYVTCSLLTALGGVMVMAQLGIGDANQGVGYTLSSIAAVVLGGASLFGGRGSFIGAVFGAALIVIVNSTTSFIGLSDAWQYWFIGFLTLGAVAIYSQARRGSQRG